MRPRSPQLPDMAPCAGRAGSGVAFSPQDGVVRAEPSGLPDVGLDAVHEPFRDFDALCGDEHRRCPAGGLGVSGEDGDTLLVDDLSDAARCSGSATGVSNSRKGRIRSGPKALLPEVIPVATPAGATAFVRIPCGPYMKALERVNPITACLLAV